ncbi:endonuclease/exonuclease/phosphatase family protein [Altererythrobacter arenosus]|uniref:Endonuclease/exonuclease/phosphatase family protein n=1 Tax=Altererythrobacter arenosus TaxID=3032592 RepID=A0ABY8FR95_9SPHN|nr:endonuclease/exonuclease/phosphatase family protein [Altererythrobacter sp. CAU 1644]WFL77532.1 endonuclease/exonuclease/phosphatase family protein [Altererythrobacter sp. CAU 1644]
MADSDNSTWKRVGVWIARSLAAILVIGSLLSTTDLNQWWIRIWDFPRLQILIAMVLLAAALWFFDRAWRPWLPLVLAGFCVWQFWRIWPYTPMASAEVARVEQGEQGTEACFTALTLNVLQSNREYDRTADLIRRTDPDIVLLMETDEAWAQAMAPVLQSYPEQIHRPLDNTYGIMFASRLPMRDASIQDLAQADTPSVFATLTAGARNFRMIALHPRPPQPRQDTEERDAEIVMAARKSRDTSMPVLAIGDFNDVAWSDTTRLFKDVGSFLDPRVGRGPHATFPAGMVWLGWPLDHLFVTEEFLFKDVQVSKSVGSDHRAMIAELCLSPETGRARNEETEGPDAKDEAEADEVMEEFKEDEAKDRVEGEAG